MKKLTLGLLAALIVLAAPMMAQAKGTVARAMITTDIVDREPINDLDAVPASEGRAYFFTDLRDMQDTTVTHRWSHGGDVQAEVNFNVRGPRWRVWSSKAMQASQQGEWIVEVVNEAGAVIEQKTFRYGAEAALSETAPVEEAPAEEAPVEEAPAEEAPTEEAPVEAGEDDAASADEGETEAQKTAE